VVGWWSLFASSVEVCVAAASLLSTALFQRSKDPESLTPALLSVGILDLALSTLSAYPQHRGVTLETVPLLLRLGFTAEDPAEVIDDEVAGRLRRADFLASLRQYLEGLKTEDDAGANHLDEPIIFERTANSTIVIADAGLTVRARDIVTPSSQSLLHAHNHLIVCLMTR
jgi:hypothetical protein